MDIYLIEGTHKLLGSMSEEASAKAKVYLDRMGVHVITDTRVVQYDGNEITLSTGSKLYAHKVIWAAGIRSGIAQ